METEFIQIAEKPRIAVTFLYVSQYPHVLQIMHSDFLRFKLSSIC